MSSSKPADKKRNPFLDDEPVEKPAEKRKNPFLDDDDDVKKTKKDDKGNSKPEEESVSSAPIVAKVEDDDETAAFIKLIKVPNIMERLTVGRNAVRATQNDEVGGWVLVRDSKYIALPTYIPTTNTTGTIIPSPPMKEPPMSHQKYPKVAHWHVHAGDQTARQHGHPSTNDLAVQATLEYPMILATPNSGRLEGDSARWYREGKFKLLHEDSANRVWVCTRKGKPWNIKSAEDAA